MNRLELNGLVIAGFILLCVFMLAVGWLGDKAGLLPYVYTPAATPSPLAMAPKLPKRPGVK